MQNKMNRLDEIFKQDGRPSVGAEIAETSVPLLLEGNTDGRSTTPPRQDRVPNIQLPDATGADRASRPSRPMTDD